MPNIAVPFDSMYPCSFPWILRNEMTDKAAIPAATLTRLINDHRKIQTKALPSSVSMCIVNDVAGYGKRYITIIAGADARGQSKIVRDGSFQGRYSRLARRLISKLACAANIEMLQFLGPSIHRC